MNNSKPLLTAQAVLSVKSLKYLFILRQQPNTTAKMFLEFAADYEAILCGENSLSAF